ncbi:MAG: 2,3-bisphosphoglycerate-independent phosphoglycerate mutase [Bacillota bacterium]
MKGNKLVLLCILDGYGINPNHEGNAVYSASKPNIDRLMSVYPNTVVHTSGMDVGLPEGQMGNSEVGHTNIGAGRIVYQELTRITKSILDGDFFDKQEFLDAVRNAKETGKTLHLFGLLSDGGVHSHNTHLYALVQLAKREGLENVCVHCFLDGRDVPPDSGKDFVQELQDKLTEIGVGKIATVMGRYYAMDRDNRWERVKQAYDAMVNGVGLNAKDGVSAVSESYARNEMDEFVKPTVIIEDGNPVGKIGEGDSVIFFNFRPDRAREITRVFVDPSFDGFEKTFFNTRFITMTQYDDTMPNVDVAFKPTALVNTFGEYISRLGYTQLRIAETEKYAHVTFFFNGGVEEEFPGEDRALIPSPKVATYDMKPEMSAFEVCDEVIKRVNSKQYDIIILNFANADMVGHTGMFNAAKTAVEAVDKCVGVIATAVEAQNGVMLITADHGNSEQMIDYATCGPFTAHTTNVVPLIGVGLKGKTLDEGRLCDLTPTILDIMGLPKPEEMTGHSLLK